MLIQTNSTKLKIIIYKLQYKLNTTTKIRIKAKIKIRIRIKIKITNFYTTVYNQTIIINNNKQNK